MGEYEPTPTVRTPADNNELATSLEAQRAIWIAKRTGKTALEFRAAKQAYVNIDYLLDVKNEAEQPTGELPVIG